MFLTSLMIAGAVAGNAPGDTCGAKAVPAALKADIVDTAVSAGSFNTLVTAVKAAGLVETLKGEGPFTVFAPTDEAFAAIPEKDLKAILADKAKLTAILTYHVVPARAMAKDVLARQWHESVQGQELLVRMDGKQPTIDGANIVATDIECSNGVIHVIDRVILPKDDVVDTAVKAGSFQTLVAAVKAAGLVDTLKGKGPFTVFAPSDEAFAAIPEADLKALLADKEKLTALLTYHVVPGKVLSTDLKASDEAAPVATVQGSNLHVQKTAKGAVNINDAKVIAADILCGNGVIHVIDRVVMPGHTGNP